MFALAFFDMAIPWISLELEKDDFHVIHCDKGDRLNCNQLNSNNNQMQI